MRYALALTLAFAVAPFGATAQDAQTLADIRQELTVLNVEVQRLRRELSTTGAPTVATGGASVLDRMNTIEGEVRRLTSKTEELEFRINRVVEDGTNRIGDLEFRLIELEGGDLSTVGQTLPLGGEPSTSTSTTGGGTTAAVSGVTGTQLAVGEEDDFKRAQTALAEGDYKSASTQFASFAQNYPGSPLAAGAELGRGEALENLGDTREAARAFLGSFSADPTGPAAAQALFRLGRSLGTLGQTDEACVTLGEVELRFPNDPAVQEASDARSALGCA